MKMRSNKYPKIRTVVALVLLSAVINTYARNSGGNGGGSGNCNGNGNIKHGCGSSVITPDILTQTSLGNPKQPVAPIPTANQVQTPNPRPGTTNNIVPIDVAPTRIVVRPPDPPQTAIPNPPQIPPPGQVAIPTNIPGPTPTTVAPINIVPIDVKPTHIVVTDNVPTPSTVPKPPQSPPPGQSIVPALIPTQVPVLVVAPKSSITSPQSPTASGQGIQTAVQVSDKASSAAYNQNMIANNPGRQIPGHYAIFRNEDTGSYRECVVSGLERRKVVAADGSVTYRGAVPSLRTVSAELIDIPSWHPHEAGCIISLQHNSPN